jgi:thiol-disulfide isomerase/thioredoxin
MRAKTSSHADPGDGRPGNAPQGIRMRSASWLLFALSCLCTFPALAAGPGVGDPAPTAIGKDRDGNAVDLASYRGKIVVITFWASWCPPCRHELPMLDDLQKQAGDRFLQVIAVNEDEDLKDYRAMTRQMKDFSLLLVRDTARAGAASQYGIRAYPNLWIIDPQGNVVSHDVGYGEDSFERIVGDIRGIMEREIERQDGAATAPAGSAVPAAQAAPSAG